MICDHCGARPDSLRMRATAVECWNRPACLQRVKSNAALVRALTAQAWAVACALQSACDDTDETGNALAFIGAKLVRAYASELPAPADLAASLR